MTANTESPGRHGYANRVWWSVIGVLVIVAALVIGFMGYQRVENTSFTAYFSQVNGLYTGDPVKILGVKVGSVSSITPRDGDVRVRFSVDRDVAVPAGAKALIVAQSLVTGRFLQLSPVYSGGPRMAPGADIPMDRTAVPVEWDDIKAQLSRLSTAVGPQGADEGSVSRAIGTTDANLRGNGAAINESLKQLSAVAGTLGSGSGDLFATVKNLQTLTDALAASHEDLVQFNGRIASVSQVLADNTDNLDGALRNLDTALGDLRGFLDRNSSRVSESVARLADTTSILASKNEQIRGLLHSAPTQLTNFYNIYDPLAGAVEGIFGLGQFSDLVNLLCGTLAANDRPGLGLKDIEKCVDILGPVVSQVSVNYPPATVNPIIGKNADPGQVQYQDPSTAARAKAAIRELDAATRARYGPNQALANLLVPFGAEG